MSAYRDRNRISGISGYRSQPVSNRTSLYLSSDFTVGLNEDLTDFDRQFKKLLERTETFTNRVERLQNTSSYLKRGFRENTSTRLRNQRDVIGSSYGNIENRVFHDEGDSTTEEEWKRFLDAGILIEKAVELVRQRYRYPKPSFEYSPESPSPRPYEDHKNTVLLPNPRSPRDKEGKRIRDLGCEIPSHDTSDVNALPATASAANAHRPPAAKRIKKLNAEKSKSLQSLIEIDEDVKEEKPTIRSRIASQKSKEEQSSDADSQSSKATSRLTSQNLKDEQNTDVEMKSPTVPSRLESQKSKDEPKTDVEKSRTETADTQSVTAGETSDTRSSTANDANNNDVIKEAETSVKNETAKTQKPIESTSGTTTSTTSRGSSLSDTRKETKLSVETRHSSALPTNKDYKTTTEISDNTKSTIDDRTYDNPASSSFDRRRSFTSNLLQSRELSLSTQSLYSSTDRYRTRAERMRDNDSIYRSERLKDSTTSISSITDRHTFRSERVFGERRDSASSIRSIQEDVEEKTKENRRPSFLRTLKNAASRSKKRPTSIYEDVMSSNAEQTTNSPQFTESKSINRRTSDHLIYTNAELIRMARKDLQDSKAKKTDESSTSKKKPPSTSSFHEYVPEKRVPLRERLKSKTSTSASEDDKIAISSTTPLVERASRLNRERSTETSTDKSSSEKPTEKSSEKSDKKHSVDKDDKKHSVDKDDSLRSRFLRRFRLGSDEKNEEKKDSNSEKKSKKKGDSQDDSSFLSGRKHRKDSERDKKDDESSSRRYRKDSDREKKEDSKLSRYEVKKDVDPSKYDSCSTRAMRMSVDHRMESIDIDIETQHKTGTSLSEILAREEAEAGVDMSKYRPFSYRQKSSDVTTIDNRLRQQSGTEERQSTDIEKEDEDEERPVNEDEERPVNEDEERPVNKTSSRRKENDEERNVAYNEVQQPLSLKDRNKLREKEKEKKDESFSKLLRERNRKKESLKEPKPEFAKEEVSSPKGVLRRTHPTYSFDQNENQSSKDGVTRDEERKGDISKYLGKKDDSTQKIEYKTHDKKNEERAKLDDFKRAEDKADDINKKDADSKRSVFKQKGENKHEERFKKRESEPAHLERPGKIPTERVASKPNPVSSFVKRRLRKNFDADENVLKVDDLRRKSLHVYEEEIKPVVKSENIDLQFRSPRSSLTEEVVENIVASSVSDKRIDDSFFKVLLQREVSEEEVNIIGTRHEDKRPYIDVGGLFDKMEQMGPYDSGRNSISSEVSGKDCKSISSDRPLSVASANGINGGKSSGGRNSIFTSTEEMGSANGVFSNNRISNVDPSSQEYFSQLLTLATGSAKEPGDESDRTAHNSDAEEKHMRNSSVVHMKEEEDPSHSHGNEMTRGRSESEAITLPASAKVETVVDLTEVPSVPQTDDTIVEHKSLDAITITPDEEDVQMNHILDEGNNEVVDIGTGKQVNGERLEASPFRLKRQTSGDLSNTNDIDANLVSRSSPPIATPDVDSGSEEFSIDNKNNHSFAVGDLSRPQTASPSTRKRLSYMQKRASHMNFFHNELSISNEDLAKSDSGRSSKEPHQGSIDETKELDVNNNNKQGEDDIYRRKERTQDLLHSLNGHTKTKIEFSFRRNEPNKSNLTKLFKSTPNINGIGEVQENGEVNNSTNLSKGRKRNTLTTSKSFDEQDDVKQDIVKQEVKISNKARMAAIRSTKSIEIKSLEEIRNRLDEIKSQNTNSSSVTVNVQMDSKPSPELKSLDEIKHRLNEIKARKKELKLIETNKQLALEKEKTVISQVTDISTAPSPQMQINSSKDLIGSESQDRTINSVNGDVTPTPRSTIKLSEEFLDAGDENEKSILGAEVSSGSSMSPMPKIKLSNDFLDDPEITKGGVENGDDAVFENEQDCNHNNKQIIENGIHEESHKYINNKEKDKQEIKNMKITLNRTDVINNENISIETKEKYVKNAKSINYEIISNDIKAYLADLITGVANNNNIDKLNVEIKKENKKNEGPVQDGITMNETEGAKIMTGRSNENAYKENGSTYLLNSHATSTRHATYEGGNHFDDAGREEDISNSNLTSGNSRKDETLNEDSGNLSSSTTSSETHTTANTKDSIASKSESRSSKKMSKFVFPKQMSIVEYRRQKHSENHSEDENMLFSHDDQEKDRKSSVADISDASDDIRQRKKYYRHSKKDIKTFDDNLSSGEDEGEEMSSFDRLNNRHVSRTRSESSDNTTTHTSNIPADVNTNPTQRFNERYKVDGNV